MERTTIIIPTHNYGHYIAETLDSLLGQTYGDWECIIVDDGSVDNTQEVVSQYVARDTRFRYIYQECQGVSAARNIGLQQASGAYIQFLDADDLLPSEKLALHTHYLEQNPGVDIVYSDVRYFANDDQSKLSFSFDMANVEWMPKVDGNAIPHLVRGNIMPIHSPLSRAKLLTEVGLFNSAMRYCEDWDYWFRCAAADGQIRYLDEQKAIVLVRVHKVSASQNTVAMMGGGKLMTEQFIRYLKQHPTAISQPLQNAVKRARAIDLMVDGRPMAGLLLGLGTTAQPSTGDITLRDIFYWFRKTLITPVPKQ